MIKEQIINLRKNMLNPKEEISVNSVFTTIIDACNKNKGIIQEYFKLETGKEFNLDIIAKTFVENSLNPYGNVARPFINDYGKVTENMVPYGIVGIKVDKLILFENYLQIIKVCLETRNAIILKPYKQSKTLELIVTIINDILKQTPDFNEILLTNEDIQNEDINLLIYVGSKQEFNKIQNQQKIFVGVGIYELYVDEVLDDGLIEFAKRNNIEIYSSKDEDSIAKINEYGGNYCTAIMSSNQEKIREFMALCKSSYILVNMSPMLINNVNLFPEQLLKRVAVVVYAKNNVN